jgi:N-acetylneuraminic acid mutarotase
MFRFATLFIALLAACGPGVQQDPKSASAFSWSARAALPVPRTDHALLGLAGKLYALGGFSGSTLARVDAYDPASDTWTRRADLLTARREFAAGALNGKIYAACGMSWSDPNAVTYVNTTEQYDPVADVWTTRAPCPIGPASNNIYGNEHIGGAAAANGRLYMVVFNVIAPGGAAIYEYDPVADHWTTKAPPPFSSDTYVLADLNGALYLLASQSNGANPRAESKLAQYDPAGNVWIIRASLPGVWWSGVAALNGKLYAFGGAAATGGFNSPPGVRPTSVLASVNEYDPTADQWTSRGQFGVARLSAGTAVLGTSLYVTGGSSATSRIAPVPLATVEAGL